MKISAFLIASALAISLSQAQTLGDALKKKSAPVQEAQPAAQAQNPEPQNAEKSGETEAHQLSAEEIASIKIKAEAGDAESQLALGALCINGYENNAPDAEKGLEWINKAAAQNLSAAQQFLGYIYGEGRIVKRDYEKAAYWRELAAKDGSANDKWTLGSAYLYGFFMPKDQVKAVEWITAAADEGHIDAINKLIEIYTNFKSQEHIDYWKGELAKTELEEAKKGNVRAMAVVAEKFMSGKDGLPRNRANAIYWYKTAADKKHPDAMMAMGKMYAKGRFVSKNPELAQKYFDELANADIRYAVKISDYYADDRGGYEADIEKANEWFERWVASDMADVTTRLSWAWKYWAGASGLKQDREKAAYWAEKAIEANDAMLMTQSEGAPVESLIKSDNIRKMIADINAGKEAPQDLKSYIVPDEE